MMEREDDDPSWRRPKLFLCGLQEFTADLNKRPRAQETKIPNCRERLLRKTDRRSERLEKQKEKRESLREVREDEYWSVEKVTDGSTFAYEQHLSLCSSRREGAGTLRCVCSERKRRSAKPRPPFTHVYLSVCSSQTFADCGQGSHCGGPGEVPRPFIHPVWMRDAV